MNILIGEKKLINQCSLICAQEERLCILALWKMYMFQTCSVAPSPSLLHKQLLHPLKSINFLLPCHQIMDFFLHPQSHPTLLQFVCFLLYKGLLLHGVFPIISCHHTARGAHYQLKTGVSHCCSNDHSIKTELLPLSTYQKLLLHINVQRQAITSPCCFFRWELPFPCCCTVQYAKYGSCLSSFTVKGGKLAQHLHTCVPWH